MIVIVGVVMRPVISFLLIRTDCTTGKTANSTADQRAFQSITATTRESSDSSTSGSTRAGASLRGGAPDKS